MFKYFDTIKIMFLKIILIFWYDQIMIVQIFNFEVEVEEVEKEQEEDEEENLVVGKVKKNLKKKPSYLKSISFL